MCVIVKLIIVLNVRIGCFIHTPCIVGISGSLRASVVRITPGHAAYLLPAFFPLLDSKLVARPVPIAFNPHLILHILQSIILGVAVFFLPVLVGIGLEVFDVLGDGVSGLWWGFVGVAESALSHGYA